MQAKFAAGVVALAVLLALPAAQASFEVKPDTCKPNGFKWASSCYKTIQAGGTEFKAKEGITMVGDQYFTTKAAITGAGELEDLYQQECAAKDIKVDITVPKGHYRVTIYEAEIYFVNATDDDNKFKCPRIFSVCGESYMWEDDLCLYQKGINTAYPIAKTLYVDDGSINLHFWSSLNMPKLAGVLVEGLDCPGNEDGALRTGPTVVSQVCVDAAAGKLPPLLTATPTTPDGNTTTNGTKVPVVKTPTATTNATINGTAPAGTKTPATKAPVNGTAPAGEETPIAGEAPVNGTIPAGAEPPATAETPAADGNATAPAAETPTTPAGEPGSFGLPAGAPVPVTTSRDLPKLGGKPLNTTVTQYAAAADPAAISGAPDSVVWPDTSTAGDNSTSSVAIANFGLPTSAAALTVDGNFTKDDKVNVTVSGTGADGAPVSRDIKVTAPTTGPKLAVPIPADFPKDATVAGARIMLPEGSTAKIDAIQLKGDLPEGAMTELETYDNTTGSLTQWPISAGDSADTPGLNGAGTNSVDVPDGALWAPTGNGTRSITLNYTDAATPTHVLLAGAPAKGAKVAVLAHSEASPEGVKVFDGAVPEATGAYGTYVLPLTPADVPANTTALTLETANPTALGLDSAALVGPPADPTKFTEAGEDDQAMAPAGGAAGSSSRDLVLPVATKPGTWASGAQTGSAVIPSEGTVPAPTLSGTPADEAVGNPDGRTFGFPASAKAVKGATPFLALEYPDGKKGNLVSVAGKAVAPGSLTVAVVDKDGKITNLGAKELPTASDAPTYVNFTTPDGKAIDIKKVVLTPTPASAWLTDAVEINEGSMEAGSRGLNLGGKRKHRKQRINGSHGAWIAVITIFSVLGFCLCCCLPICLYLRSKKTGSAHASTGTYAAPAAKTGGLFSRKKATTAATTSYTTTGVTTPTVVKNAATGVQNVGHSAATTVRDTATSVRDAAHNV